MGGKGEIALAMKKLPTCFDLFFVHSFKSLFIHSSQKPGTMSKKITILYSSVDFCPELQFKFFKTFLFNTQLSFFWIPDSCNTTLNFLLDIQT